MKVQATSAKAHSVKKYFVDESGDGVLFDRKGNLLFQNPSNLQHFMLGMIEIENEEDLAEDLNALRKQILQDPYYRGIPSLQKENKKTAIYFHAKDDLPEVRKEVFSILKKHSFRFYAVVKNMKAVFDYVKSRNANDSDYRYKPNELYDLTVRALFKDRLHVANDIEIIFAQRGKRDRTKALTKNIELTRQNFYKNKPINPSSDVMITVDTPQIRAGLQCVDYCLWALQRAFERNEERYISFVWDKIGLIHDMDNKSIQPYGTYINRKFDFNQEYLENRQI